MRRKVIHLFVLVLGLSACSISGAAPLVQDSFDGASLDLGKWQVLNGPDVSVTQAGGQVQFSRPKTQLNYLLTAKQFDPAVTPLIITGSVTLGPDGDMDVWTRANALGNTGGGPGHVLDSGIRVNFWRDAVASGYPPVLDILEKTPGVWPWDSSISGGANIPGSTSAVDWSFVITDDGTTITATFTQTSDPANTLTLTGTSTTRFAKNYVAFTVTNGYLNDVSVDLAPLVADSFDGASLDLGKWQVLNGPDVSVTQAGGQVQFSRPKTQLNYLLTAKQFDPAVTPLIITGSVTLGPDGDMDVWTRANAIGNTGGGPGHVLDSGIRVNFWRDAVASGYPPVLDILEKTAGVWPWNSSISGGANIPGNTSAVDWSFVVTDDGTTITATFTQTSDPTNTLTLTGTSTTRFAKNYVAFTVTNGSLNDVSIALAPLAADSFDGASLDLGKWQVLNGPDVSVTQAGGQVQFSRPKTQLNYLLTAKQFDPAVTPLVISGSVTLGPDADMDIWTRANAVGNTGGGPGHVLDSGIRVNFWRDAVASGYPPVLDILEKTPGVWPWDSSISGGANIPGSTSAVDWSFVITDDGTTITATFTQTSDPTNTLWLTGTSTTHFAKNYVAFTVVNGSLNDVSIVTYRPKAGFTDDFETAHDYVVEGLGSYAGLLDNGTIQALNASITSPGSLYMATANGVWDPGPGPLLYVEVSGDFVATVKVTGFAGTLESPVLHNDAGIMARNPASDGGVENWVSVNYFPTWTAFVARNTTDGTREELGQTAGRWTGVDTYALAAQYPYIQLERKGSDFSFKISADGVNFLPLTAEAYTGIYDGTQTPLVVSRPDLPTTLQVGLFNVTYSDQVGYVAFDNFSIAGR